MTVMGVAIPLHPSQGAPVVPDSHGKHIQVVCRVKPHDNPAAQAELFTEVTPTTITMPTTYARDLMSYRFHRVFQPGDSEEEIFDSVSPVVEDVLRGVNGAILAYGQAHSGKTRTMVGTPGDDRCVAVCAGCVWQE